MRLSLILLLMLFISMKGFCQQTRINFILSVDDVIKLRSTINSIDLEVKLKDGSLREIQSFRYSPGETTLADSDYIFLKSPEVTAIHLKFNAPSLIAENYKTDQDYDINLGGVWLSTNYFILYVYNINNPRHKGDFDLSVNEKYVYEYLCNDISRILIRTEKGNKNHFE